METGAKQQSPLLEIKSARENVPSDLMEPRNETVFASGNSAKDAAEDMLQRSKSTPIKFKKSAMLADTQAIRAVTFHPSGNYFAVGTNSKALKICRKRRPRNFERYVHI